MHTKLLHRLGIAIASEAAASFLCIASPAQQKRRPTMATVTVRNGIDVQALLDTIEAIKTKPELAEFTFRASTSWQQRTASTAQIGAFVHAGDEDESRT